MNNLKSEIEKLVNYASENMGNDVLLSQTVDDILSLFKQQMKEVGEKIEKLGDWEEDKDYGLVISHKDWKAFRKELLKNIEEL